MSFRVAVTRTAGWSAVKPMLYLSRLSGAAYWAVSSWALSVFVFWFVWSLSAGWVWVDGGVVSVCPAATAVVTVERSIEAVSRPHTNRVPSFFSLSRFMSTYRHLLSVSGKF